MRLYVFDIGDALEPAPSGRGRTAFDITNTATKKTTKTV